MFNINFLYIITVIIVIILRCVIVEGLICSIRTGTPVDSVHVYDFLRSKFTS